MSAGVTAVVSGVEGTLSAPGFTRDVLRPYLRRRLASFLEDNAARPEIAVLLSDAARDAGLPGLSAAEAATVFEAWMDAQLNVTTLLTLQGMIAEDGYRAGDIKGQIYGDAADALARWNEDGLALYVYSPTHAPTEKLRFRFSDQGDLTHLIAGWLDPNLGPAGDPASYRLIARAIRAKPDDVVFLSASPGAIAAAHAAGLRTAWIVRPDATVTGETPPCDTRADSLAGLEPRSVGD